MRPLVLGFDRVVTLADPRTEKQIARLTGAVPEGATLPLNAAIGAKMQQARAEGRPVFVVAQDGALAQSLLDSAGIVARVIAVNAPDGAGRLRALRGQIGDTAFDFIGHDPTDQPLWRAASGGGIVDRPLAALPPDVACKLRQFPGRGGQRAALRALRPHHWIKNSLVFLSLVAAQSLADPAALIAGAYAFVTFCLLSSAVYLVNDVFDLADDRRHPHKRRRPLADGQMGLWQTLVLALGLCLCAFALAAGSGPPQGLLSAAMLYACVAIAYSRWLKTLRYVDLVSLGGLYTLRVIAGGWAAGLTVSVWLLALCLCLFTSLAAAKRVAELHLARTAGVTGIARRRYRLQDARLITGMGLGAALGAGMVLIGYAQDPMTAIVYARPMVLNLAAVWLTLWVLRIWHKCLTGKIGGDPILFALKDWLSWACAAGLAVTVRLAVG